MKRIDYYTNKPDELINDINADIAAGSGLTFEQHIDCALECMKLWPIVEAAQKAMDKNRRVNHVS